MDLSLDSNVNVTLSPSKILASTPFKQPFLPRGRKAVKKRTFVRPVCDICQTCGKEYRCHRSYLKHVREHSIRDASSKYPNGTQILEHCSSCSLSIFQMLKLKPAFESMGGKYKAVVEDLTINYDAISTMQEWSQFLDLINAAVLKNITEHKILLPSALLNVLIENSESVLCNITERKTLNDLLQFCVPCDLCVANCFIADYILSLVKSVMKFYGSCLRATVTSSDTSAPALTNEEKETIHYISGSVLRGFYKKSLKFPKNVGWCHIATVINSRLLESDTVPGPSVIVKGWTNAMSKGKLFFISGCLFDFFVAVAEILERTTHKKLRIDYESVLSSVCKGVAVLLWDEAVGDSLSETASYEFMCGMIRSFCNTYGVGMAKKVLNSIRQTKAEANIPLRHKVAPKS